MGDLEHLGIAGAAFERDSILADQAGQFAEAAVDVCSWSAMAQLRASSTDSSAPLGLWGIANAYEGLAPLAMFGRCSAAEEAAESHWRVGRFVADGLWASPQTTNVRRLAAKSPDHCARNRV